MFVLVWAAGVGCWCGRRGVGGEIAISEARLELRRSYSKRRGARGSAPDAKGPPTAGALRDCNLAEAAGPLGGMRHRAQKAAHASDQPSASAALLDGGLAPQLALRWQLASIGCPALARGWGGHAAHTPACPTIAQPPLVHPALAPSPRLPDPLQSTPQQELCRGVPPSRRPHFAIPAPASDPGHQEGSRSTPPDAPPFGSPSRLHGWRVQTTGQLGAQLAARLHSAPCPRRQLARRFRYRRRCPSRPLRRFRQSRQGLAVARAPSPATIRAARTAPGARDTLLGPRLKTPHEHYTLSSACSA